MRDWLVFNILILEENASVTCRKGTLDVLVVSLALSGCTISSPGRGSCFSFVACHPLWTTFLNILYSWGHHTYRVIINELFWWCQGLNSGPWASQASAVTILNPEAPFILLVFETESLCSLGRPWAHAPSAFTYPESTGVGQAPCAKLQSPLILMKRQEVRMM